MNACVRPYDLGGLGACPFPILLYCTCTKIGGPLNFQDKAITLTGAWLQ